MPSTKDTAHLLRSRYFADPNLNTISSLNQLLRLMARWRAKLLTNTYVQHHGVRVYSGPFKGMEYLDYATEGCLVPRLLGCYEDELHADLQRFVDMGVDTIVDIGCAEGYYAVGLARFMPAAQIHAFEPARSPFMNTISNRQFLTCCSRRPGARPRPADNSQAGLSGG